MNYEKAYREALERAREIHRNEDDKAKDMEFLFPELKESEDEHIRKCIIAILDNYVDNSNTFKPKMLAWLEKQGTSYTKRDVDDAFVEGMAFAKDELEKQGKQKSADEVLKIRQEVYQSGYNDGYKHGVEDVKQGEQKSSAWSKEDENMFKSIIATCELAEQERDSSPARHLLEMQTNWLKSIKERVQPQNTWKPSEGQMGVIEAVINNRSFQRRHLDSLYNDLKKLKG